MQLAMYVYIKYLRLTNMILKCKFIEMEKVKKNWFSKEIIPKNLTLLQHKKKTVMSISSPLHINSKLLLNIYLKKLLNNS